MQFLTQTPTGHHTAPSKLQNAPKEQRRHHSEKPSPKMVFLESPFCPLRPWSSLSNNGNPWKNPFLGENCCYLCPPVWTTASPNVHSTEPLVKGRSLQCRFGSRNLRSCRPFALKSAPRGISESAPASAFGVLFGDWVPQVVLLLGKKWGEALAPWGTPSFLGTLESSLWGTSWESPKSTLKALVGALSGIPLGALL